MTELRDDKQDWEVPTLTVLGDLETLTAGALGMASDGMGLS
jgi:hypothetical protein